MILVLVDQARNTRNATERERRRELRVRRAVLSAWIV
jgi:hypothetical protein